MSKDVKKEKAAESGKPLTEEELEAVVGGSDFIDLNPNNPGSNNPAPAPDPPPFPSDIATPAG